MNKQYIKRQITLHKLGLPIGEDIKEYYDYFHSLLGNITDLEELIHDEYPHKIFWQKEGELILDYNIEKELFWVEYHTIWEKIEGKYLLKYNDTSELIKGLLEEAFKIRVTTIGILKVNCHA